jgi:hypothetical protein
MRISDVGTTRPMPPAGAIETPIPMTPSIPPPPRESDE